MEGKDLVGKKCKLYRQGKLIRTGTVVEMEQMEDGRHCIWFEGGGMAVLESLPARFFKGSFSISRREEGK